MEIDRRVLAEVEGHPHPLVFVTISGAHLYGFASPDSDWDVRGVHVLPLRDVIGLMLPRETHERSSVRDGLEIDLVTHDVAKFFGLLLKKNGYVLEQLTSPLVVRTSPEHEELKALVPRIVTRHHAHHYLGFQETQWRRFQKETPRRVKPLLYVYRVLLTGIHLVRTGEIEANLGRLNASFHLPQLDDLIARKVQGNEQGLLVDADLSFHARERERLVRELEDAARASALPEAATAFDALDDLLVRIRLARPDRT